MFLLSIFDRYGQINTKKPPNKNYYIKMYFVLLHIKMNLNTYPMAMKLYKHNFLLKIYDHFFTILYNLNVIIIQKTSKLIFNSRIKRYYIKTLIQKFLYIKLCFVFEIKNMHILKNSITWVLNSYYVCIEFLLRMYWK